MKSRYEKEINEYLKNGGTIQRVESPKRTESDLLKESVTTVRDLEPHEVTAISWEQAMAETEEEREDKQYWTDLNKTLDRYIKKHKVPELMSAKLFWLDNEWVTCYTKGIVKLMMNPFGVTMKRNEMRKPKTIINYRDRVTQQEKNVDSRIVSTRPTHKVKGVEVIDGVEYYVLSV